MHYSIEKILKARWEKGLSQSELAEKAGLGKNTLSRIEAKKVTIRHSTMRKIATALNTEVKEFLVEDKAKE